MNFQNLFQDESEQSLSLSRGPKCRVQQNLDENYAWTRWSTLADNTYTTILDGKVANLVIEGTVDHRM